MGGGGAIYSKSAKEGPYVLNDTVVPFWDYLIGFYI